jgi:hypothetical protein
VDLSQERYFTSIEKSKLELTQASMQSSMYMFLI